jgi:ubiquinone/menaquinone biosynthesis C-methylase UbiE
MNNLYSKNLAQTYDEIYQGFINYTEEYEFYSSILKKHKVANVLEIACGSGNLARKFSENFEHYTGLDYSEDMLKIAHQKYPNGSFIQGDMRDFKSSISFNGILITGRSTSYLLTNKDLEKTFDSVSKSLEKKGVFIFDFIDADRFIPFIKANKIITHESKTKDNYYTRQSVWEKKIGVQTSLVNWSADYFLIQNKKKEFLGNDTSEFRTFGLKEIKQVLQKKNFQVIETIDRKTYAFDTYVVVCKKV